MKFLKLLGDSYLVVDRTRGVPPMHPEELRGKTMKLLFDPDDATGVYRIPGLRVVSIDPLEPMKRPKITVEFLP